MELHSTGQRSERSTQAVCVTVTLSGANLYWPANSADLNPIEQMWWIGKGSINREQCNTPEELSVQAQAALAVITISSVNGMVESYSTRFCAVLVLRGQCLNGLRDVMRDLVRGRQTPEGIAHAQEVSAESLQGFVKGSRELLAALPTGISLGVMANGSVSRFPRYGCCPPTELRNPVADDDSVPN
jgi:hypothetical protein